jgi:hypothetical protein
VRFLRDSLPLTPNPSPPSTAIVFGSIVAELG